MCNKMSILERNTSESFVEFCTGTEDVKLVFKPNWRSIPLVDPGCGVGWDVHHPFGPNYFFSCSFWEINLQNTRLSHILWGWRLLWEILDPPLHSEKYRCIKTKTSSSLLKNYVLIFEA